MPNMLNLPRSLTPIKRGVLKKGKKDRSSDLMTKTVIVGDAGKFIKCSIKSDASSFGICSDLALVSLVAESRGRSSRYNLRRGRTTSGMLWLYRDAKQSLTFIPRAAPAQLDPEYDVQSHGPVLRVNHWASELGIKNLLPESPDRPFESCQEIIAALNDSDDSRAYYAAIDSEIVAFPPDQTAAAVNALRHFIERHRARKSGRILTALGAAIRSYIAIISSTRLEEVASLLANPSPLTPELENEVAKMVVRKLTAVPPFSDEPYPLLAAQLTELAVSYMNPRLLTRGHCGPAAMNASLAVAVMRSERFESIGTAIKSLCPDWFRLQLGRRAGEIAKEIGNKQQSDRVESQMDKLLHLAQIGK